MKFVKIAVLVIGVATLAGCETWDAYFGCRIGGGDWGMCKDYLIP